MLLVIEHLHNLRTFALILFGANYMSFEIKLVIRNQDRNTWALNINNFPPRSSVIKANKSFHIQTRRSCSLEDFILCDFVKWNEWIGLQQEEEKGRKPLGHFLICIFVRLQFIKVSQEGTRATIICEWVRSGCGSLAFNVFSLVNCSSAALQWNSRLVKEDEILCESRSKLPFQWLLKRVY